MESDSVVLLEVSVAEQLSAQFHRCERTGKAEPRESEGEMVIVQDHEKAKDMSNWFSGE